MSPRSPMCSVMNPMAPAPRLKPQSWVLTLNRSLLLCTSLDSSPNPAAKYGRKPAPCCPPIGIPIRAFPITETTLLLSTKSKSPLPGSKNSGVYDRSASHPKIPAPIHPIDAPYVKWSLPFVEPPNVAPRFGVNNQSAWAAAGESASTSAAITTHFFNIAVLLHFVYDVSPLRDRCGIFPRRTECKAHTRRAHFG